MFQQLIIIGNVGREPEMRYTPQGIAVCDFSVAVNKVIGKGEGKQEQVTWFKVTVWREKAEIASQWIKKGMKIMVIGEVKVSAYIAKDGKAAGSLEVTADEFKFLGDGTKGEQKPPAPKPEEGGDIPF